MPKNIVLCLDGTGNQLQAKGNTNVVRLYQMLALDRPAEQVVYYDPGVGTFGAQGAFLPITRTLSRWLGLAFGYGLRSNLADAYTYLMHTYEPGDRIFLFGFSRGAYTARAFAGLLNRAGLLSPGAENLIPYALGVYARKEQRWTSDDWHQTATFANTFSTRAPREPSVPIHFLGLWDSVKAAGMLRRSMTWPDTRDLPNATQIRHAVSIDEKRRPYREYLVQPKPSRPGSAPRDIREVWFAGVHSDIGGTFEDDSRLADINLKWMAENASELGLLLKPQAAVKLGAVKRDYARGRIHRTGWLWILLTYRRRPIFPPNARVHSSVRARMEADSTYKPRLGSNDVVWDDSDWANDP